MLTLHRYQDEIEQIIDKIRCEFWPSNLLGAAYELTLKRQSKLVVICMYLVVLSAIIFAYGFLSLPLREGSIVLPFASWYPFDWRPVPVYEMIYLLQWICNIYIIVTTICAHDFLFLAIACNCIAQFRLLKKLLGMLGEKCDDFDDIMRSDSNKKYFLGKIRRRVVIGNGKKIGSDADEELLVLCVVHHQMLIRICDLLKKVYNASLMVQLLASVTAICVSSFLMTLGNIDKTQVSHLFSYCVGHVMQLFFFCAAANELSFQSSTLGEAVFKSKWYNCIHSKTIKICMLMMTQRSHTGNTITAMGLAKLNYVTFVAVLRLSFSFYTLLSNLTISD